MLSSSIGKKIAVTVSGGSHEKMMTLTMEGVPSGYTIDRNRLLALMKRRAPGQGKLTTSRKEDDIPYLSDSMTGGFTELPEKLVTPESGRLDFVIFNKNARSEDYRSRLPRPGHSDLPARIRYGDTVNMAGGGPFSGRMTAMMTLAGGIAMQILEFHSISVASEILSCGNVTAEPSDLKDPVPSGLTDDMKTEIVRASEEGDSIGGVCRVFVKGLPAGSGGPMFDGAESALSPLLFAIPGVKAVEFGAGMKSAFLKGSENNDPILSSDMNTITTETNMAGGILGGLTTGMPLVAQIAVKPVPSIRKPLVTFDIETGENRYISTEGRHDSCILARVAPVAEAVTALGTLDLLLCDDGLSLSPENPGMPVRNSKKCLDLQQLRCKIDVIDDKIIALLRERMDVSSEVASLKLAEGLPVFHKAREEQILAKAGKDLAGIYNEIFTESRRIQEDIIRDFNMRNSRNQNRGEKL